MNIRQYIEKNKITISHKRVANNPHFDTGGREMDHYRVTLKFGDRADRKLTTYFSKGLGHNGEPPTAEEVLDTLASDAAGYENARSFEEWAREYGYDTNSRAAEKIYRTIEKQVEQSKVFLGRDYEKVLFKMERL